MWNQIPSGGYSMLLCIPPTVRGLLLLLLCPPPPPHLKISEYWNPCVCHSNPCGKRAQLGATLHADTCWNIWIHDSPSPRWGDRCNQSHSSVINATPLRKTVHGEAATRGFIDMHTSLTVSYIKTAHITFVRKPIQSSFNVLVTVVGKASDRQQKKRSTCIEMNRVVCVLSSDWSATCMAPREDIGRGQTRLFQIDLSEWASGRPNW